MLQLFYCINTQYHHIPLEGNRNLSAESIAGDSSSRAGRSGSTDLVDAWSEPVSSASVVTDVKELVGIGAEEASIFVAHDSTTDQASLSPNGLRVVSDDSVGRAGAEFHRHSQSISYDSSNK